MKFRIEQVHSRFRRFLLHVLVDLLLVLEIADHSAEILAGIASSVYHREWGMVIRAILRLRRLLHYLPFPAKLGIVQGFLVPFMLFAFPDRWTLKHPIIAIAIVWSSAYCLALVIASFYPRPQIRRELVHWL